MLKAVPVFMPAIRGSQKGPQKFFRRSRFAARSAHRPDHERARCRSRSRYYGSAYRNGYVVAHLPKLGHVYVPFAFSEVSGFRCDSRGVRSGQWQAELLQPNAAHCSISSRCGGCLAASLIQNDWRAREPIPSCPFGLPELASMPAEVHASPAIAEYRQHAPAREFFSWSLFIWFLCERLAQSIAGNRLYCREPCAAARCSRTCLIALSSVHRCA